MIQEPAAPGQVREALARVLEREGGGGAGENPLARWLEDLLDALDPGSGRFLATGLVLAAALAALWAWRRSGRLLRSTARGRAALPLPGRGERVRALLAEARRDEAAGDLRRALRGYFQALVVGLGVRGELEYRSAWTLREMLLRGRPSEAMRGRLEGLLLAVEPRSFGEVPTREEDVRRVRELCDELLPAGPEAGR